MRFSWLVLALGLLGPLVVLASEWLTAAPAGHAGYPHRYLRWYSPLPLLVWLLAIGAAVYPGFPD
ncbi:MAG: hypothetical protein M3Z98_06555 [Candidatus Dormibacteraeota bacterium]|nr:hypothetical protein [Candidatus Dormibacteraeota bacterium]